MRMNQQYKVANIVFVEDNLSDIEYIKTLYKKNKLLFNMHICRDGEEILDFLHKRGNFVNAVRPDLIVLDLSLPKFNGIQILKMIKKDKTLRSIPISILSSSRLEDEIAQAYKHGAKFYMFKPFNIDVFLKLVGDIETLHIQKLENAVKIYGCKCK